MKTYPISFTVNGRHYLHDFLADSHAEALDDAMFMKVSMAAVAAGQTVGEYMADNPNVTLRDADNLEVIK